MKKIIAIILLAAVTAATLIGCGGDDAATGTDATAA